MSIKYANIVYNGRGYYIQNIDDAIHDPDHLIITNSPEKAPTVSNTDVLVGSTRIEIKKNEVILIGNMIRGRKLKIIKIIERFQKGKSTRNVVISEAQIFRGDKTKYFMDQQRERSAITRQAFEDFTDTLPSEDSIDNSDILRG